MPIRRGDRHVAVHCIQKDADRLCRLYQRGRSSSTLSFVQVPVLLLSPLISGSHRQTPSFPGEMTKYATKTAPVSTNFGNNALFHRCCQTYMFTHHFVVTFALDDSLKSAGSERRYSTETRALQKFLAIHGIAFEVN
ncbi:hypothetical protein SEVIR_4G018900v4 [Setaria viridis]